MAKPAPEKYTSQRMLLRIAISLFLMTGLVFGVRWLLSLGQDPDLFPGDSRGMIAAVEFVGDGSRTVVFKGGEKQVLPGWRDGVRDESPVWRPDGQRLFFVSDREEQTIHIFRWRPGAGEVERRSIGTRSRSAPTFFGSEVDRALITSGNFVAEYIPRDGGAVVVLPPPTGGAQGGRSELEEQARTSAEAIAAAYQRLGTNFEKARYLPEKSGILATLRRENVRLLVYQSLVPVETPGGGSMLPMPVPLVAGTHVDFDIAPSGLALVTVVDFDWPDPGNIPKQFIVGNVARRPYVNAAFLVDVREASPPRFILSAQESDVAAVDPRFSPDGQRFLLTSASLEPDGSVRRRSIGSFPVTLQGGQKIVAPGEAFEAAWSPDGLRVAYAVREGANRPIYVWDSATGQRSRLTPAEGEFGFPAFSPQFPRK